MCSCRLDWQSRYGEGPREPNQARFAGRGEPDGAVPGLPPPPAAAPAAPERKRVLSSAVVVADSAQRAVCSAYSGSLMHVRKEGFL
jgi:hypothetical protein